MQDTKPGNHRQPTEVDEEMLMQWAALAVAVNISQNQRTGTKIGLCDFTRMLTPLNIIIREIEPFPENSIFVGRAAVSIEIKPASEDDEMRMQGRQWRDPFGGAILEPKFLIPREYSVRNFAECVRLEIIRKLWSADSSCLRSIRLIPGDNLGSVFILELVPYGYQGEEETQHAGDIDDPELTLKPGVARIGMEEFQRPVEPAAKAVEKPGPATTEKKVNGQSTATKNTGKTGKEAAAESEKKTAKGSKFFRFFSRRKT